MVDHDFPFDVLVAYAKINWTKLRCEWKQIGNA